MSTSLPACMQAMMSAFVAVGGSSVLGRRRSPTETWEMLRSVASRVHWAPLPTPGPP